MRYIHLVKLNSSTIKPIIGVPDEIACGKTCDDIRKFNEMSDEESRTARSSRSMPLEDPRIVVAAVAVRLPPFWPANPRIWFVQVEAQFSRYGITTSRTRYEEVVCALPTEYATDIQDLLLDPHDKEPYEKL